MTAGTRHYTYDEFEDGSLFGTGTTSALILNHPNGACTQMAQAGTCGAPISLSKRESGFVNRANLTWHYRQGHGHDRRRNQRGCYCSALCR